MLKNKVVVITGGAGLIGKEFVRAVVENGGIAIIADINEELILTYKVIRDNMGWDNWTMEIIAFHNCEDLHSAKKQEQQPKHESDGISDRRQQQ